ncbi:PDDEXK family nuclease [Pseudomonas amygdali pv. morsprunorum]
MDLKKSLLRITGRQGCFEWGDNYLAGIYAVPGEAPKGSRICRLNSRKLGRALHLLSTPERIFAQLALYNPDVFELHEQKILSPIPQVHPLQGNPLAAGLKLLPVKGTSLVAEEIGLKHATAVMTYDDGGRERVPHPYLGDLLLYIHPQGSAPYAVNWTVKLSAMDFDEVARGSLKSLAKQKENREKARLRHALEEVYYHSAGIRTVRVSRDMLDPVLVANLDLLYGYHDREISLESDVLEDFSHDIEDCVAHGRPVASVALMYGQRWGRRDLFLTKIYKDIWERKLSVSLFDPVLIDHPLVTDAPDVLQVYSSLFAGLPE